MEGTNNSHERFLENIKKYKSVSLDEYEESEAKSHEWNEKRYDKEDLKEAFEKGKYSFGSNFEEWFDNFAKKQ